jgi:uncharacterized membrane protein (DUF373 family)
MISDSLRNLRDQGLVVASDADLDCEIYEKEFTTLVDGLSTIIEPLMIVFVGAMIGVMVVALYLPIFSAGNAIH